MSTISASPQNGEPGKARLTMEIDGRHAIPVRAIPFITKGRLSADDLARKLAGREKHFPGLENLVAYYLVDGKPLATEARDWGRVSNDLEAFKTNLREKHPNPDPENAYDARGANEWEQKSAWMLPADCFVWRDEFDREYRAYRPDDIEGPNYAPPMLTDAAVGMIWEGFNVGAQDIADMAEFVNNDCAIDWEFWIGKMSRWTAGQAARLMAALDPGSFSDLTLTRDDRRAGAAREKARRFERLAAAHHMTEATPAEWLAWADRLHEPVHSGFRISLAEGESGRTQAKQPGGESVGPLTDAITAPPIPSPVIASAFDGLNGWDRMQWARNLGDPRKWLEKARVGRGVKGAGGSAIWNPVTIALELHDKGTSLSKLDAVFRMRSMKAWAVDWEEKSSYLRL